MVEFWDSKLHSGIIISWDALLYAGNFRDETGMIPFFQALEKRGYNSQESNKIAYRNFIRFERKSPKITNIF